MKRHRLPSLKRWSFWIFALVLALIVLLLRAQLDHHWPMMPLWARSIAVLALTFGAGEVLVRRYWPAMRRELADSVEVFWGLAVLTVSVTVLIVLAGFLLEVYISPDILAWATYLCYTILDASYQW